MALPMKKKSMKKTRSKVATGRMAKSLVLRGSRAKTSGGLTKDGLIKNKRGKIVSKKASALRKKLWQGSRLALWVKSCSAARKQLAITGFVAINGRSAQGKALYAKAKTMFDAEGAK